MSQSQSRLDISPHLHQPSLDPLPCQTTATGRASPCLPCSHRSGDLPETVVLRAALAKFQFVVDDPIQSGNAKVTVLISMACALTSPPSAAASGAY